MRRWQTENADHWKGYLKKYGRTYSWYRRKFDEEFRIKANLRTRLRQALKGKDKNAWTVSRERLT